MSLDKFKKKKNKMIINIKLTWFDLSIKKALM